MFFRARHVLPVIAATLLLCSCEAAKIRNRAKVAKAYAEVMIVEQQLKSDSLSRLKAIDSVLKIYGYDSRAELISAIRDAGEDPDGMRMVLDSTQRRMDLVQKDSLK